MIEYTVIHDYGMGSLSWRVQADSEEQILRTFAEVVVATGPLAAADPDLEVVSVTDEDLPETLAELREQRREQMDQPGFGALVGRGTVYLKQPDLFEEGEVCLAEYDDRGYRTRIVALRPDGSSGRSDASSWTFNPPEDLWDPELAAQEIDKEVFEDAWNTAEPETWGDGEY